SLSTRTTEGKALLRYLEQHSDGRLPSHAGKLKIGQGIQTLTGCLAQCLQLNSVKDAVERAHKKHGDLPQIIPLALVALIERLPDEMRNDSGSATLFGLQAIKNSAVHAFSDPYKLHFLINRNSHSGITEKRHYLNADNEQWINAAGRITREVMQDLINNVFDLNFADLNEDECQQTEQAFNDEFSAVTNTISY
ncbi:hypothetical protein ACPV51_21140, partial [Vibrio astriarenae]